MDAGVDAAAGDKSAAGPTSMTVWGRWVVEVDADAGDGSGDTVASSAVGGATAAAALAAGDCEGEGCSAGDGDAADSGFAIGEACGAAESVAGDGAVPAQRNEESSVAEDGASGDDCAAGDDCIEAGDAAGSSASGASAAVFGIANAEGVPVGDPAMAVDTAFTDAAFVDEVVLAEVVLAEVVLAEVVLAVDATADMPAGGGKPALVASRLTTDADLAAGFAAVCVAFNGAAADAGIDDSVIAEDASGRISSGPPESRVRGTLSASAFIGISTMRACGASGTSTVCSPA
jgi:hypothetical protein